MGMIIDGESVHGDAMAGDGDKRCFKRGREEQRDPFDAWNENLLYLTSFTSLTFLTDYLDYLDYLDYFDSLSLFVCLSVCLCVCLSIDLSLYH